jgi:sugar phosphate isomerase/epimerase
MARLAMSEMTTFRWSLEEDAAHYQEAGISAIGVWRQKLTDVGIERGAELLAKHDLKVSSLHWAGGFTGAEGRTHQESVDDGREAVREAHALDAACLVLHTGPRGGHTLNHSRRLFRTAVEALLPLAEEFGIALAIEPMTGECGREFTFLNTLQEARELVESYSNEHLRIVLDIYHWGHETAMREELARLTPLLALVQIGDGRCPPRGEQQRCPLGQGSIPLREILRELFQYGYQGYCEVELLGEEIESAGYQAILANARNWFDELATLDVT